MRTLLIPALFAGCTTGPVGAEPSPFAACVVPAAVPSAEIDPRLVGPVLDAGVGEPPDDCFRSLRIGSPVEVDAAEAWWLQAADETGMPWTVGVWLPGGPTGPGVGDDVTVAHAFGAVGFGPRIGQLELRDGDGALILWIGAGGDLPDIVQPPEATVAQGEIAGEDGGECGAWTNYELLATVGGETAEIGYGEVVVVDGIEVRHGGFTQQRSSSSKCLDWSVSQVAVAFSPAP